MKIATPRWSYPLLKPDLRYLAAYGGRGSGKSHFFGELMVERCIAEPGVSTVCVREYQKTLASSVKKLIENKVVALGVRDKVEFQRDALLWDGGGKTIFMGMSNVSNDDIKSLEGFKYCWVEESQTLSQRSLDILRPTIRMPGSQLWFGWNPDSPEDAVDKFFRGGEEPPRSAVVRVNYTENPWFPAELVEEMEYDRRRDPDKYAHVWLGEYDKKSNSRVFNNWRVEEFEAGRDDIFRFGADWGFAKDPTVLVRCFIRNRTLFIDYEAYQVACEIADTPDLFLTVPESERYPITADSARPETISHLKNNGFPKIVRAVKGPNSVDEGVEWLKSFDIVIHPRCVHTIDEMKNYSYKVDPNTNEVLNVLRDKHNHVIDALRYACEGARRTMKKPKSVRAKKRTNYNWMGV